MLYATITFQCGQSLYWPSTSRNASRTALESDAVCIVRLTTSFKWKRHVWCNRRSADAVHRILYVSNIWSRMARWWSTWVVGVSVLEDASELSELSSKLSSAPSPPRVLRRERRERRACRVLFFPPLHTEVEAPATLSAHAHWERWSPQKPV